VAGVFVVRTMTRMRVRRRRSMTGVRVVAARNRPSRVRTMLGVPGVMSVIRRPVTTSSGRWFRRFGGQDGLGRLELGMLWISRLCGHVARCPVPLM
jgi:hypothetical protein